MIQNNIIQTMLACHVYPGTQIVATNETARTCRPSIYHKDCEILVSGAPRCGACTRHRKTLCAMLSRTLSTNSVIFFTCDGASTNHRLWRMHYDGEKLTYKVNKIFASDTMRPLYFISDVPHLIKTVWNCWLNTIRCLEVCIIHECYYTLIHSTISV